MNYLIWKTVQQARVQLDRKIVMSYTIYTRVGYACPWCDKAADLLDQKGLRYSLKPLDKKSLLKVASKASMSSIPIVYNGEELIGGYSELNLYLEKE